MNCPMAKMPMRIAPAITARRRPKVCTTATASPTVRSPGNDRARLYGVGCAAVSAPRSLVSLFTKLNSGSASPAMIQVAVNKTAPAKPDIASTRVVL